MRPELSALPSGNADAPGGIGVDNFHITVTGKFQGGVAASIRTNVRPRRTRQFVGRLGRAGHVDRQRRDTIKKCNTPEVARAWRGIARR